MINKVAIRNFKSLRDVQIELERFTVFVGPNASGKSSILQGMNLLCRAFHPDNTNGPFGGGFGGGFGSRPIQDVETEVKEALSRTSTGPVELAGEFGENWYRYLSSSSSAPRQLPFTSKSKEGGGGTQTASTFDSESWQQWTPASQEISPPPRSILLRLESSKLVQPVPAASDTTLMEPDGTGLHSSLANIALSDPESWQTLQEHLREIVPTVRRLRHTMKGVNNSPALLFDMQGADSLPASQVSEGTLLVLGLLTALHTSERPDLVLLDDIDRGLHPKAQRKLIELLRKVLDSKPDLQIVATTHSPYLLGSMEPSEVRMTHLDDHGWTVCASLTEHPKFETWKDEMSAGEMWSLFGERWVVEQEAIQ